MSPARRTGRVALAATLLALTAPGALSVAAGAQTCDARQRGGGSVSIVVLASGERVRKLAATVKGVEIVRRDEETVIFADGRVITADVEATGRHLNDLGWGHKRVEIAASVPARGSFTPG